MQLQLALTRQTLLYLVKVVFFSCSISFLFCVWFCVFLLLVQWKLSYFQLWKQCGSAWSSLFTFMWITQFTHQLSLFKYFCGVFLFTVFFVFIVNGWGCFLLFASISDKWASNPHQVPLPEARRDITFNSNFKCTSCYIAAFQLICIF